MVPDELPRRTWAALMILAGAAAACGLLPAIFEPDAALYAGIARTMVESGDWVQLRVDGTDWLDKPHLPFWLAAASFEALGVSDWAYRLPALLASFGLGGWYTYRLARRLHDAATARLAVLFLCTAYHFFVSVSDVRAEALLLALVVAAYDHLDRADEAWHHALVAGLWAGLAAMTKGPFVLIPICGGIVLDRALSPARRRFLWARLPVFLAAFALAIVPELVSLVLQFDAHPEKELFGHTQVSGVRFFFWDSQFGRFFNTGPIRGLGSPLFFFHTQLWALLPWSGVFSAGALAALARLATRAGRKRFGWSALGLSTGLTFLVFSASSFQLPHYLVTIFPFCAVLCAGWLREASAEGGPARALWTGLVWLGGASAWGLCAVWAWAAVEPRTLGVLLALVLGAALAVGASRLRAGAVSYAAASSCALFIFTFTVRDTMLSRYQSGSVAARLAAREPRTPLLAAAGSRALDFYRVNPSPRPAALEELVAEAPLWIYAERDQPTIWAAVAGHVVERVELPHFRATRPTLEFLNRDTREATVEHRVLIHTVPSLRGAAPAP